VWGELWGKLPLKDAEHFTVHDMRRTARTQMAALGINRFVAERALNHNIRSVEGIYGQHDYFSERKIALAKWAALLVDVATSATQG
jgi:integrase